MGMNYKKASALLHTEIAMLLFASNLADPTRKAQILRALCEIGIVQRDRKTMNPTERFTAKGKAIFDWATK